MSTKSVRMSVVALSAAVMAVIWVVIDTYTYWFVPTVLVSAVTSLVMLVAQFFDFKMKARGDTVLYEGGDDVGSDT